MYLLSTNYSENMLDAGMTQNVKSAARTADQLQIEFLDYLPSRRNLSVPRPTQSHEE